MSRIVRYHADRTNQKLYFARMACQSAEQIKDDNIQLYQAHREAVVFHLYGAYTSFLQELVRFYRLSDLQPSLESIEQALAQKGQISPEINQLKQAVQTGFLRLIIRNYHASLYTPESKPTEPEQESQLIIKAIQTPQHWLAEIEQLKQAYQQLLALIEDLRREMVEF